MKVLGLITAIALAAALFLGGTAPLGRVLLSLGLPKLAVLCFDNDGWLGVAHYRAGDMDQAVDAFTRADAHFNLGNAHAQLKNYAAALESYDVSIARGNADARANFDAVMAIYASLAIDPEALALFGKRKTGDTAKAEIGEGNGRAAGAGSETTNANTMLGLAQLDTHGRLGVRRVFDDKFMVADERWLQQLSDVPGEYLQARINHERKRRMKLGLTPPDAEDPR